MSLVGFWPKMMEQHMRKGREISCSAFDRMMKDCDDAKEASPDLKKRLADARKRIRE